MSLNPENKCAHLFNQSVDLSEITIEEMFKMQRTLQDYLAARGRAIDFSTATFGERVSEVSRQWRNMNTEMAELIERLPYKEWKTYSEAEKSGFTSEEHRLEVLYEYIDVFHFFVNVGLALGIDGETFKRLYATKNKENFDRQNRGY
jgi:dimeric dUTPase (all-alpha-NTP-PPase superfamily)